MFNFLTSRNVLIFSTVAVAQAAAGYYLNAREEYVPPQRPLAGISDTLGAWTKAQEWAMEPEIQAVLKADDTLARYYVKPGKPQGAILFIASFQSQRSGRAPHSPKNCLPGNGWVKEKAMTIPLTVPGRAEPIHASYYLVQKGNSKSVVIYWYQSHGRIVAGEYEAKFFVVADAIRYNRTDTSLVKFTVDVGPDGPEKALETASDFIASSFGAIEQVLPQ